VRGAAWAKGINGDKVLAIRTVGTRTSNPFVVSLRQAQARVRCAYRTTNRHRAVHPDSRHPGARPSGQLRCSRALPARAVDTSGRTVL